MNALAISFSIDVAIDSTACAAGLTASVFTRESVTCETIRLRPTNTMIPAVRIAIPTVISVLRRKPPASAIASA